MLGKHQPLGIFATLSTGLSPPFVDNINKGVSAMAYGYAEYEAIKTLLFKLKITLSSQEYQDFMKGVADILKI